jgi:phage tail sheath gpL-like
MSITNSSLAAGVGIGMQQTVFQPSAQNLPRKMLVIGTPLASATGWTPAQPQLILNPADGAARYGASSCLGRLLAAAFAGTNYGVPIYAFPETETGTAAVYTTTFTGTSTAAGILYLYVAGTLYQVPIPSGTAATAIPALAIAYLNADPSCPVTASGTATLICTADSKGIWGNGITIAYNQTPGDQFPAGITAATVVATTAGAGVPGVAADIANGLGSSSAANQYQFTDIVHGYLQDATTIAALSTYNGVGNVLAGCYDNIVARPFRVLMGDTLSTGSAALTALLAIASAATTDRTNGIVAVPGSLTHPSELAAIAMGLMAKVAANNPAQSYVGQILTGVDPGYACAQAGNRWTSDFNNRNTAVSGGISPTLTLGSTVVLQNVVTFYGANQSVPVNSNIYREMRNIALTQNILYSKGLNYAAAKWAGYTIVADASTVTDPVAKLLVRDVNAVIDDEIAMAKYFQSKGWIYTADFTIKALKTAGAVSVRSGGDGFTISVPYILSGIGNVINEMNSIDTSIAVLTN